MLKTFYHSVLEIFILGPQPVNGVRKPAHKGVNETQLSGCAAVKQHKQNGYNT